MLGEGGGGFVPSKIFCAAEGEIGDGEGVEGVGGECWAVAVASFWAEGVEHRTSNIEH